MKTFYQIKSEETGKVVLKCRRVAKALRWWLRGNGHNYEHGFFLSNTDSSGQIQHDPDKR